MILTAKQHKWLDQIASSSRAKSSMYAGLRADLVPDKMLRFFQGAGYVDVVVPHNLAHKDRIVITHLGLEALSARDE